MIDNTKVYVYPKFDSFIDIGIRIGGFGLANCLFVYSRAIVVATENNYPLISPTWERFGIGQYLRNEKDKRNYLGLFEKDGVKGFKKYMLLFFAKKNNSISELSKGKFIPQIIKVEGLSDYFESLIPYHAIIKDRILSYTKQKSAITSLSNYIGIHVRLGDYTKERRTSLDWYIKQIEKINMITQGKAKFLLFSDGSDIELKSILEISNVSKCFTGNALSDILTLSNCSFIIGSDSTFSGWAVFLGQKPAIFKKKHFGRILINQEQEVILSKEENLPLNLIEYLQDGFNITP